MPTSRSTSRDQHGCDNSENPSPKGGIVDAPVMASEKREEMILRWLARRASVRVTRPMSEVKRVLAFARSIDFHTPMLAPLVFRLRRR